MTVLNDNNNFSNRLKRYGAVSIGVGGIATRMAWHHLFNNDISSAAQAKIITDVLADLKGPAMKIAQMLATIPDAIPPEYAKAFLSLQSDAPAMGWPFIRRRMQNELGLQWQDHFQFFDKQACAAASLGQVHKAIDHYGNHLACKLQYPEMAAIIDADLNQLKAILSLYKITSGVIDTENIFQEIKTRLNEELDYRHEADNLNNYRSIFGLSVTTFNPTNSNFSNQPYCDSKLYIKNPTPVCIPRTYPKLSTQRLLTMDFLTGNRLKALNELCSDRRNLLARQFFIVWYYPLYHYGMIHGDPHFGNYTINNDLSINLYDFGCVRQFNYQFIQGVFELYQGLKHSRAEQINYAYELWGFKHLSKALLDTLNLWAKLFYEPILDNRVRPLQSDNRGHHGRHIAAKVYQNLQSLGGVKPPREFVFMDRATVGLGSVCMTLGAELNWYHLFYEIVQDTVFEKYLT